MRALEDEFSGSLSAAGTVNLPLLANDLLWLKLSEQIT